MNEAIHVDAKGRRWQRIVLAGVITAVLATAGLVVFLIILANSRGVSDQEAARDTRALLAQYTNLVYSIEPQPSGTNMSVDDLKQKLTTKINEEIRRHGAILESTGRGRDQERNNSRKAIRLLQKALTFTDGKGEPFVIKRKEAGLFEIRSTSASDAFTEVQVPLARAESSL